MVDDRENLDPEDKKEDSFEFDSAGEAVGYISLMQARLLAIKYARENTEIYGSEYSGLDLVWELLSSEEDEDYYHIKLSWRPAGRFQGKPGIEEFFIEKNGTIELRQLLDEPTQIDNMTEVGWKPLQASRLQATRKDESKEPITELSVPRFTDWTPYAELPWRNAPRLPGVVETRNANTGEHTFIGSATGGTGISGYIERRDPVENWANLSGYEKDLFNRGGSLEVHYAVSDSKEHAQQQRNLLIHKYREEQGKLPLGQLQTPRLCPRSRSRGCSICKE